MVRGMKGLEEGLWVYQYVKAKVNRKCVLSGHKTISQEQ